MVNKVRKGHTEIKLHWMSDSRIYHHTREDVARGSRFVVSCREETSMVPFSKDDDGDCNWFRCASDVLGTCTDSSKFNSYDFRELPFGNAISDINNSLWHCIRCFAVFAQQIPCHVSSVGNDFLSLSLVGSHCGIAIGKWVNAASHGRQACPRRRSTGSRMSDISTKEDLKSDIVDKEAYGPRLQG
jgi:hypothetical protein